MPSALPEERPELPDPKVSIDQINNCIFSSWYPCYKNVSPKAKILKPLGRSFIEYLLSDGITLPKDEYQWKGVNSDGESEEEDSGDEEEDEDEEEEDPTEKFKEFHQEVQKAISDLGGRVIPKLNWSTPKDATWIATTHTLECVTASDIYILLKASSYIDHDLTEAYDQCYDYRKPESSEETTPVEFELVLREYFSLNPAMEFRCFVKDRVLVGISQRDMNYYAFLEPTKDQIQDVIEDFFVDNLKETFPDSCFVFDVYIPRPFTKAYLIDINPYAAKTDSLLFSWSDIISTNTSQVYEAEFRLVDRQDSSRGFGSVEHTESYVPKDFVDAAVNGTSIDELSEQWRSILIEQESED